MQISHKSHWKIIYIVTTEYVILGQNQHSIFIFHHFMLNFLENTFKLKFDSCQTWMQQSILLWPRCTQAAGIRLGTEMRCSRTQKETDSLHFIPGLMILTWLWISFILSVNFASSMTILSMWLNLSAWPPSKRCWEISLSFAGASYWSQ